jgi:hypothetical protein
MYVVVVGVISKKIKIKRERMEKLFFFFVVVVVFFRK